MNKILAKARLKAVVLQANKKKPNAIQAATSRF